MGFGGVPTIKKPSIGVVVALPAEARSFAMRLWRIGQIAALSDHLLLQVSGMGAQNATAAATQLLTRGVDVLISWGTAGGLASHVRSGDLMIPDRIIGMQQKIFSVSETGRANIQRMFDSHFTVLGGALLHTTQVIDSPSAKQALYAHYQAVAVDMESAAVAQIAAQAGVDFLAVRAIVDGADRELPSFLPKVFNKTGQLKPLSLIFELRRYAAWLKLFPLMQDFYAARATLSRAARLLMSSRDLVAGSSYDTAVEPRYD